MKKQIVKNFLVPILLFISCFGIALAYEIQDLTNVDIKNDFVLGPGKIDAWLSPGESYKQDLLITNRLGRETQFRVQVEDFKGSRDPEEATILLGEEKGPYSLRDYIKPELYEFNLKHGQRIVLPIEINIPKDAEPGGLFGAVLISSSPSQEVTQGEKDKAKTQMNVISRLGTLIFVRVKGDVKEDGFLKEIKAGKNDQRVYEQGPVPFDLYYENNGNVSLNPYGFIEIKNILGKKIDEIEVKPFFAMPDSLRMREIKWDRNMLFGRYTATLFLNRGYKDIVDTKSVTIWIMPWKIITIGSIGLVFIVWILRWLFSRFEFRRKSS